MPEWYTPDNKTILEPIDDAAHVNWGGDWRMPTKEDFEELLKAATQIVYEGEGVSLYFNNNLTLHFPLSGFYGNDAPTTREYGSGGCGRYWSSNLALDPDNQVNQANAMYLLFPKEGARNEDGELEQVRLQPDCRFYGHTIRAVMSKFTPAQ